MWAIEGNGRLLKDPESRAFAAPIGFRLGNRVVAARAARLVADAVLSRAKDPAPAGARQRGRLARPPELGYRVDWPVYRQLMYLIAKVFRVSWKLAVGCYW